MFALHKFPLTKPLADKFRENVSGSRDGRPDWVLTIGKGSGDGLFGPNSAVWQVHGTIATLVGGVRALLLQAAHPAPLSGVAEHSRYETDPLGRLAGTTRWLTVTTFAAEEVIAREAARVNAMHDHVKGNFTDKQGHEQSYKARDPRFLLWVHCAFTDSFLKAHLALGYPIDKGADAYVVYGNSTGGGLNLNSGTIAASNGFKIKGLGGNISSAGDVNGDGLADIIVAGPSATNPAAFVVYGNASGTEIDISSETIAASNGFKITGRTGSYLGGSVSSAGDVNGDGLADLIVGAGGSYANGAGADGGGAAYIVYGNANGATVDISSGTIAPSKGFKLTGEMISPYGSQLGASVASAGDINGDGFADLPLDDKEALWQRAKRGENKL